MKSFLRVYNTSVFGITQTAECSTKESLCTLHSSAFIHTVQSHFFQIYHLTLTVLVATIDAQWEGMGDVGSARYEPALLPPCLTIRVLSYSN